MSRREPLPPELPAQVRRLVDELRLHKDRSGLSLAALSVKTAYGKSSWYRYLNGIALPPWQAVDGLARLAEADRARLRVLWESAAKAWEKPSRRDVGPEARQGGERRGRERTGPRRPIGTGWSARNLTSFRKRLLGRPVVLCVLAAATVVTAVLALRPWNIRTDTGGAPAGAPAGTAMWPWALASDGPVPGGVGCRGRSCAGRDPYLEHCDRDSRSVHSLTAYGRTLTLRYSRACRAAWADVTTERGTSRLLVTAAGAATRAARAGASHTVMADTGPDAARAGVVVAAHQLGVSSGDSWVVPVSGGTGRG